MLRPLLLAFGSLAGLTAAGTHALRVQTTGAPVRTVQNVLLAAKPASPLDPSQPAPLETERASRLLATLQDPRLDESSGLAASRRYPGWYWTHNDSGDVARAFLIDGAGKTRLVINLRGARAIDWEDCAVATTNGRNELFLSDTGDNLERRLDTTVYRVHEADVPTLDPKTATPEKAPEVEVPCEALTLQYPDGPHDAETLIAAPDGRLLVVSKSKDGSGLYVTPAPFGAGGAQTLRKIGALRFGGISLFSRLATGGDLSPDASRLVIRTYTHAYEWQMNGGAIDGKWWQRPPHKWVTPSERQGESIAYASDGRTLLTTSEKLPTPLHVIEPETTEKLAP